MTIKRTPSKADVGPPLLDGGGSALPAPFWASQRRSRLLSCLEKTRG